MLGLITPTSDRPKAFMLCERWMQRAIARYGQPVCWIVVDDGATPVNVTMGQVVIRREPSATAAESFLSNVAAGLNAAEACEKILIIEDDEWYSPDYLTAMCDRLDEFDLVGEAHARYYSVHDQRYWIWDNELHASFAQTGFRGSVRLPLLALIGVAADPFIDRVIWRLPVKKDLAAESQLSVGMKGLPGKGGFTDGHRGQCRLLCPDHTGAVLTGWTGTDAEVYKPYSQLHSSSIIIPSMGCRELLEQTIPRMIQQEHRSEVVVVESAHAHAASDRWQNLPGVRVVRGVDGPEFLSRSRARNLGVRAVDSHWCIMADADVLMPPEYVGGLIADCLRHDWQLCCAATHGNVSSQCCVARFAWETVGGYDEAFEGWRSEDHDFYTRLQAVGIRSGKREGCGLGLVRQGNVDQNSPTTFPSAR